MKKVHMVSLQDKGLQVSWQKGEREIAERRDQKNQERSFTRVGVLGKVENSKSGLVLVVFFCLVWLACMKKEQ